MPSPLDALKAYKPSPSPEMLPMAEGDEETPEGQEDQTAAGYLPPEDGPFQCQHCAHFQAPNACEKVSGMIDPEGCCNYYLSVETGKDNPGGAEEALEGEEEEPEGASIALGGASPYGR